MKLLKDRQGSMIILAPVLLLVLMTFFASLFEYSRLNTFAANINSAAQAALTQICTDNASPVYTGVREGYSGGYKLENTNWTPSIDSGDIMAKIDKKLGTSNGVKMVDGKLIYKITDLSVTMKDTLLAPSDPDNAEQLNGKATYTLTVPLSFGWSALPPMVTHMEAKSGYSQQGELRGDEGSGNGTGTQVEKISLNHSSIILRKGETDVLAASVLPEDADNRKISWASGDSSVCTVTQTGVIIAIAPGETSVVAIAESGKTAQCDVTVISPVTGVTLDKSSINMIPGATDALTATVAPADATNKGISWVSSDLSVCTVSSSGKVTAIGAGQSTITVMTQEGGYYAECVVKVTIPVTGITMDKTSIYLLPGATDTLTAVVWPENATQRDVLWASSDSSVCSVDQSGNIAGIKTGSAVITATTKDGQYTAQCIVQVGVPVRGISVNPTTLTLVRGTSKMITPTISPSDATDKGVTWDTSNSGIATVDSTGRVTAVNTGSAVITVQTHDGGFTAKCNVTVVVPVTGVTLNQSNLSLVKGHSTQLTATVKPSDATNKSVTWRTSNSSIATVDNTGRVTAVNGGSATITVRTSDGGYTASCKVSVTVPVTGVSLSPSTLSMSVGDTHRLTANVSPGNATDKGVTWSTSNSRVATVNSSGNVTAIGSGSAVITVTTNNGHYTATCAVTVKANSTAEWTFSKKFERKNGKDGKWYKKDRFVNGRDISLYYSLYKHGHNDTFFGTYTFKKPFTLEQGGKITIYHQSGLGNFTKDSLYINNDRHNLHSSYWDQVYFDGTVKTVVDVPKGTKISSISYRHPFFANSHHHESAILDIFISPKGSPTFMLNSSGTSKNQDVDFDDLEFPLEY